MHAVDDEIHRRDALNGMTHEFVEIGRAGHVLNLSLRDALQLGGLARRQGAALRRRKVAAGAPGEEAAAHRDLDGVVQQEGGGERQRQRRGDPRPGAEPEAQRRMTIM